MIRHCLFVESIIMILDTNVNTTLDQHLRISSQCLTTSFFFLPKSLLIRLTTIVIRHCFVVVRLSMTLDASGKPSYTMKMSSHIKLMPYHEFNVLQKSLQGKACPYYSKTYIQVIWVKEMKSYQK